MRHANAIGQGPWVLGTVQLGQAYGAANTTGMPSQGEATALLADAAQAGVTHVDTARAYGLSEERIGEALRSGLAGRLHVVTKVRPLDDVAGDAKPARAAQAVRASVSASLEALGTDRVDALLLHRWADWGKGSGAVADTLAELRLAGVTTLVGTSLSGPDELVAALADERVGYVQFPFNLLDRRWLAPGVQAALAARPDVVVTVRSVFLQGLLVAGTAARWPANAGVDPAAVSSAVDGLVRVLGRNSAADLCVAYARGHAWVDSVVLGADTADQVRDQATLVARPPLTADEIATVRTTLPAGSPDLVDPARWHH